GPTATSPGQLVIDFFNAAAGGGETAARQVTSFFTSEGRKRWHAPGSDTSGILVIHVNGVTPETGNERGQPANAHYRGGRTHNDKGRINLAPPGGRQTMRLYLHRADGSYQFRIDDFDGLPPGLVLEDQALNNRYYRQQPIYFWDTDYKALVPD